MKTIVIKEDDLNISEDFLSTDTSFALDSDTKYFWGDIDHQDGTYFRQMEPRVKKEDDCYDFYDVDLATKKEHAVLYFHLHQELMFDKKYKTAYDALRDEKVKKCLYWMEHKVVVGPLTDEERETQTLALDMGILERGKKVVNTYKSDAEYIAEKIISGESLFEKK